MLGWIRSVVWEAVLGSTSPQRHKAAGRSARAFSWCNSGQPWRGTYFFGIWCLVFIPRLEPSWNPWSPGFEIPGSPGRWEVGEDFQLVY